VVFFLIRGENVVLAGEIDEVKSIDDRLTKVSLEEILSMQAEKYIERKQKYHNKKRLLKGSGRLQAPKDILSDDTY